MAPTIRIDEEVWQWLKSHAAAEAAAKARGLRVHKWRGGTSA